MGLEKWLRRQRLRDWEQTVLDSIAQNLNAAARTLLADQLAQVTLTQRHAQGKEVNLYAVRHGGFREASLFPLRDETRLATVSLTCADGASVRVEVWIVGGHVFSMEFSRAPSECAHASISNVQVDVDPMVPARSAEATVSDLRGWLAEQVRQGRAVITGPPPSPAARERLVTEVDARLPDDYRELASQTGGFTWGDWRVLGLSGLRTVVEPDRNLYVVAEAPGRVLALVRSDASGVLHAIDLESEIDTPAGTSIVGFLEQQQ